MFDQLPNLCFKLPVIIPEYSRIAESTYTRVIPLMIQFLVLKCVSTYARGQLIHEYMRYSFSLALETALAETIEETHTIATPQII